jgi:hypothetical protein
VRGHAKTRDVNAALKELKKEYLKDDEDHLQIHLDRFYEHKFKNAWESPVELFEDLLEINDEIEACDDSEAKSARSLFVHFKGLRPRVDTENPGSLESQIGMKYDSFWNDSGLKAALKRMSVSEFKDKLRMFDDTELSDLVKEKRVKEAKKKEKKEKKDEDSDDVDSSDDDDTEKKMAEAFVAMMKGKYKAKFNGKCYYCKLPGHRVADCNKRKREQGDDYEEGRTKCFHCGKVGHTAAKCWHKKGNQEANDMNHFFAGCVETIDKESKRTDTIELVSISMKD